MSRLSIRRRHPALRALAATAALVAAALLAGCGGGGGGGGGPSPARSCAGLCAATTPTALTVPEVERILSQAVQEAQARSQPATLAVVDRSGRVLAVFRMAGAAPTFTISGGRGVSGGLEGVDVVPSEYAAISKAITGAYLSSEGNAFSTRTAGQIVQQHFNPGERGSPGGPLFGVQFSSLSCSDIAAGPAGPRPSPLGLAADPGGLPLYKDGTVVGGIGVMADGRYGIDLDVGDVDADVDELIAVAGARGFDAPAERRAERITADGRTLRYTDSEAIVSRPAQAPATPPPSAGQWVAVPGYKPTAAATAGVAFNQPGSGFGAETATAAFAGLGAYALDDGTGAPRYPVVGGSDGGLAQAEVAAVLAEALKVAARARAQIRQPLSSPAQVSVAVVDTRAVVLGLVRTADAPVFGTDVSVQKARSALLFSQPDAGARLTGLGTGFADAVARTRALIPGAFSDGTAYTSRAVGNLARPFLPDGIDGRPPGPLSLPLDRWSPFANGLQLDLVQQAVVGNLGAASLTVGCSPLAEARNGIQIFAGGVPIYRDGTLVGAIGVSGDGIDQDDMIAFLGVADASRRLATGLGHAPVARRADRISVPGGQLRYVNCPVAPFLDTTTSDVCSGL